MRGEKFVVVCYDVGDDRRRSKIAKILEDYGIRVQYSIFECVLTESLIERLKNSLKEVLAEGDSIRYYYLCNECVKKMESYGRKEVDKTIDDAVCYIV